MMQETLEAVKAQIKEPIGHDSGECALWRTTHSNCKGCEFALGCAKYASAGIVLRKLAKASATIIHCIASAETEDAVRSITEGFLESLKSIDE